MDWENWVFIGRFLFLSFFLFRFMFLNLLIREFDLIVGSRGVLCCDLSLLMLKDWSCEVLKFDVDCFVLLLLVGLDGFFRWWL